MVPKIFSRIAIFTLILSLCLAAIPAPVLAAAPADLGLTSHTSATIAQSEIKDHVLKFYLDPALVPNMDFAKAVLPKYVEDMNTILAKNTNRRLVFNPETDIILTSVPPYSGSFSGELPVEGFEIWAHVVLSSTTSYGGFMSFDSSGAGVLAGLHWTKLYNPDKMTSAQLQDYWVQINNMLHELAHVFGAGIGEYYNLASIQDTTGDSPRLNINVFDPNDLFWSDKQDFLTDPLLQIATQVEGNSSREALLGFAKYADLTATLINGDYRNSAPTTDLQYITVSVVTDGGAPIDAANVKIWSVVGNNPYEAKLMVDVSTDSNGQASFAWGGSANPHNNYDFLRLIKVYKDGYNASAKYVSIFDADIVKLIGGSDSLNILVSLDTASTPPLPTSVVRASANLSSATSVKFTVNFSEAVTGVDKKDFSLTAPGLTGASVSTVSGSGATRTVTVSTGSGHGTLRLDVVDDDTIRDSAGNPLGGTGAGNGNYTSGQKYTIDRDNQFRSAAAQDGWVLEAAETTSETGGKGGSLAATGTLRVGDNSANEQYRSLLYFDTADLPDDATITKVTLKIRRAGVTGTDPFTTHGSLLADIKKGTFGASPLEIDDFQATASKTNIGHFSAVSGSTGWYQLALGSTNYKYINKSGVTQFRLRFTKDNNDDHGADYVSFYAGSATTASNRPLLIIEYTQP